MVNGYGNHPVKPRPAPPASAAPATALPVINLNGRIKAQQSAACRLPSA